MATNKSPTGIRLKSYIQRNFTGLDSSVDETAQDVKDAQPLAVCENAYTDWRGQIVRDPVGKRIIEGSLISHIRFYGTDSDENELVYAVENEAYISLASDKGHIVEDVYAAGSLITSTVFANKVHFCAQAGYVYSYDGLSFEQNSSPSIGILSPKYCCSVQRRLAVAGLIGEPTAVHLSRVDTDNIFPQDEDPNEVSVLRGASIDIGNQLGSAQAIKGISAFEQNRLAIFTESKTLIYVVDPDVDNWVIDDRANINIGTISHNTIKQAGTDLIFCSERGVHTIQRSRENGIIVFADVLSKKIDLIYRALLKQVANPESITAIWEPETSQYRIFFPVSTVVSKVLVLTLTGSEENPQSWSTNTYLNARCGDVQGGRTVLGTSGGVYETYDVEDDYDDLSEITMTVTTPVLWHGSMIDDKAGHSFFLHASGKGNITANILNEHSQLLHSHEIKIEDDDDDSFRDTPLVREYIHPFDVKYRGLRVQLISKGKGLLRIAALGFNVRQ